MKNGILLINLGTPERSTFSCVRRYLSQFLSDRRVVNLPLLIRYMLLYGIILPFRLKRTVGAYRSIWTASGSPLLIHSRCLQIKLQKKLGENFIVALGMRYGMPSIAKAIADLKGCEHITVFPLFPQYSSAATGSALETVLKALAHQTIVPSLRLIRDFYQDPRFIEAQANLIKPFLIEHDYLLLSYHSIPRSHLTKICLHSCQEACLSSNNSACYRAQCYLTSSLLAKQLNLTENDYGVAFQSRLGKASWVEPYTETLLLELAKKGVKKLAISCPSFVIDCLETLEEIGIQAKKRWKQLGGEQLTLIPCLNANERWVDSLCSLLNLSST